MKITLYVACLLVAQAPSEVQFRNLDQGKLEVVAPVSAAQQKAMARGKLTADQGEAWLRLCLLDPETNKPGPAMLGSYQRDNADLVFRPRFGVEPGRTYRAFFGPIHGPTATKDYRAPLRNGGTPAAVVKIYPTADVLPANHLKFYVYFSQPMRGGKDIFSQIEILDRDGNAIPDAWLADELWDETGQVLIIYIHPGRIKWGLVLRDVLGPVLRPDHEYSFVVRGDMVDANGHKLGKDVAKKFRTSAEDRQRVNLGAWQVQPPKAGTLQPLSVSFRKSLDHKSLERFLAIRDGQGSSVAGRIATGKDEISWSFTPAQPWKNEDYHLLVNGRLEDVAGNTPLRPFDLDLQAPTPPAQRLNILIRARQP
jgi:hypothetical protein